MTILYMFVTIQAFLGLLIGFLILMLESNALLYHLFTKKWSRTERMQIVKEAIDSSGSEAENISKTRFFVRDVTLFFYWIEKLLVPLMTIGIITAIFIRNNFEIGQILFESGFMAEKIIVPITLILCLLKLEELVYLSEH